MAESVCCKVFGLTSLLKDTLSDEKRAYYFAFYIYTQWEWLSRTRLLEVGNTGLVGILELIVQGVVVLLLAYSFLKQRATAAQWTSAIIVSLLGLIAWRTAAEGWLFWLVLFVVCGKGARIRCLACVTCVAVSLTIVMSFLAIGLGLIENGINYRPDGTMRNPMGFDHPNSFGAALLTLCIALIPLLNRGYHLFISAISIFLAVIAFEVADSRTAAACLLLVALALPIFDWIEMGRHSGKLAFALLVVFLTIALVSVAYMIAFDGSRTLDAFLDKALSGRLRLGNIYYKDHVPGLLGYDYHDGTPYYTNGKEYRFVVDNLYMHLLLRYGILASGLLLGSLGALFIKMIREKYHGVALFGFGIFVVYGAAEALGCRIESNFYILSLWTLLYACPLDCLDGVFEKRTLDGGGPKGMSILEFLRLPMEIAKGGNA